MTRRQILTTLSPTILLSLIAINEILLVSGNPKSRPYVAYRTDPFDQEIVSTQILSDGVETRGGGGAAGTTTIHKNRASPITNNRNSYNDGGGDPRCPLSFRLGSTHSTHFGGGGSAASSSLQNNNSNNSHAGVGMHTPPIIYPLHPDFDAGSGRQILVTTDFEVLEMWTPSSAIGTHADYNPNKSSSGSGGVEGQSAEQMKEDEQFPLLFESSSFYYSSPIVHDVEGDGVADAILGDYDGNLHLVGLDFEHATKDNDDQQQQQQKHRRKRYYKRISIPRLFVRKSWFDVAINRTKENEDMANTQSDANHTKWEDFEPYHTYFATTTDTSWRGEHDEAKARGISANVLNMDLDEANGLVERKRKERRTKAADEVEQPHKHDEGQHRRLQEVDVASEASDTNDAQQALEEEHDDGMYYKDDVMFAEDPALVGDDYPTIDAKSMDEEASNEKQEADAEPSKNWGDDYYPTDDEMMGEGIDDYAYRRGYGDDMYQPQAPDGWESYEEYQSAQDKYYHDSNYLRLPPHLLSTCTLVELPRAYAGTSTDRMDKIDEMILCSVSYYFDEDECKDPMTNGSGKSFGKHANADGGDETEEARGRYVANAIMGYNLRWKYWSIQEVLDLSTDWSAPLGDIASGGTAPINSNAHGGMGAWALATPIAVKLDGGGKNHIIVGTSMGLVYALEAQWHGLRSGWPVQLRHPVEQKVLVEDVVGNTNLEVFVVSTGGDLVSLNADGGVLWARNLLTNDEAAFDEAKSLVVRGTSPLSLGDVDGTGRLAIVVVARIASTERQYQHRPDKHDVLEHRLYAIDAVTGDDLEHFPIILNKGADVSTSSLIPQPLLIDLHEDQRHWLNQIHGLSDEDISTIRQINKRAAEDFSASSQPRPHGGAGRGVHIVQPLGSTLYIIEGATACSQTVDVGDTIPSMVQADDVHGTGGLDLVVTTSRGEILTLESDTVSYHPLNVWNAGVTRAPGSSNAQAHGFSSTQGIFVHPMSRVWRDILGVYIPITFEIFDRRPNIANEANRQVYEVEVRAGMSAKRTIFYRSYNATGIYTERVQIPFGPGYFSLTVLLRTTHGIVYEDTFHIGFNVDYMGGLWLVVFLPLVLASIPIFMFRKKPNWEEDEDYGGSRGGILGRAG
ncbi:hypothetical protein ACHAWT_005887 [Skeletonema menzelii]